MKKYIAIAFIFLIMIIIIKYFNSNYKINYVLNNHNIFISYKNKRYYIEIDEKYNFDIYKTRSLKKLKIDKIVEIDNNELYCIVPIIKNIDTHPLCYLSEKYIDYNLIDNEKLEKYKKQKNDDLNGNFSYNKNLGKKEYVFLWNYKGFYKMNGSNLETINILENGRYDNALMYLANDKILFPNYEEEYVFKEFYLLDVVTNKKEIIESKYEFSYDGYIVGQIKNKIYFYDNKNSNLYEINIKKLNIKLIGSEKLGFYKYSGKEKTEVKKIEYKNKEIYYEAFKSNYQYITENNSLYKIINDNKDIKMKIFEGKQTKIVGEHKNNLYFVFEDTLYKYNPLFGYDKIFNYFELNFNTNSIIYIYNK